mmetsp:Transcript_28190/g.32618  ORF Transcript_28190/g.32618 Transcript_28190/m.32618 type:complete len:130 (+) Transcript_28190:71-460(+)
MNAKSGKRDELEVTREDQANINLFSWLSSKYTEMQAELGAKRESITQNDDAVTEIDIGDDDNDIRLKFGECFFRADADTCREYLENSTKELKEGAAQIESQMEDTKKKMAKLKTVLYSKFGSNINLEED